MILITLKGGLVQGILSDDPAMIGKEVIVNDYDAEGADDSVTDSKGDECCPNRWTVSALDSQSALEMQQLTLKREDMKWPMSAMEDKNDR